MLQQQMTTAVWVVALRRRQIFTATRVRGTGQSVFVIAAIGTDNTQLLISILNVFNVSPDAVSHLNGLHVSNDAPASHPVRSEVLTEVTMKNVVFWDIKTQFVLHRRHITSPLQSPAG
jgi:hypothetical protein